MVLEALSSAARSLPERSELLLLPDGPAAAEAFSGLALPSPTRVVPSQSRAGLVGNWNRCLAVARGDLVHVLHDDDLVADSFYSAILALQSAYPDAAIYTTGAGPPTRLSDTRREPLDEVSLLTGDAAARFVLDSPTRYAGSAVVARRVLETLGPFSGRYPHCPDEEAHLRWGAAGGVALDQRLLYYPRSHSAQARYDTWRRSGFVAIYVSARLDGARQYSDSVQLSARHTTARRVISSAMTLASTGDTSHASRMLNELEQTLPEVRGNLRYRIARMSARSRVTSKFITLRRHLLRPR
jgi:hypothetical protein